MQKEDPTEEIIAETEAHLGKLVMERTVELFANDDSPTATDDFNQYFEAELSFRKKLFLEVFARLEKRVVHMAMNPELINLGKLMRSALKANEAIREAEVAANRKTTN